jgi:hypothetical protein
VKFSPSNIELYSFKRASFCQELIFHNSTHTSILASFQAKIFLKKLAIDLHIFFALLITLFKTFQNHSCIQDQAPAQSIDLKYCVILKIKFQKFSHTL